MKKLSVIFTPVLIIASWLFALISALRNTLFDFGVFREYRSALPVICVGNCTVGGSGKTPLVKELARLLRARGMVPVVLSRGYGGTISGPHRVLITDSAHDAGDEPVLLARDTSLAVVVSRSRVKGALFVERNKLGDVIILDDGYQHRWLSRTVNILCLNVATEEAQRRICAGRFLPWGIFRESLTSALRRADLVVFSARSLITGINGIREELRAKIPDNIPLLFSSIESISVVSADERIVLEPQPVQALCAIANPEGFLLTLKQSGFQVEAASVLGDHSQLVGNRCRELLSQSALPVVITEKDLVKLPSDLRISGRVFVAEIALNLEPVEVLDKILAQKIERGNESS